MKMGLIHARSVGSNTEQERALAMSISVKWTKEHPGVFVGRRGGPVIGRVIRELKTWEWAAYRNGWTHDSGSCATFEDACAAVERSHLETLST